MLIWKKMRIQLLLRYQVRKASRNSTVCVHPSAICSHRCVKAKDETCWDNYSNKKVILKTALNWDSGTTAAWQSKAYPGTWVPIPSANTALTAPWCTGKQTASQQNTESCKFQLAMNRSCQTVTELLGWEHLLLPLRIPGILGPDLSYKRFVDICYNLRHAYWCEHSLFCQKHSDASVIYTRVTN